MGKAEEAEMRQLLKEASEQLEAQQAVLERLNESPLVLATVLQLTGKGRGIVNGGGQYLETSLPDGAEAGSQVYLVGQTMQGLKLCEQPVMLGSVVTIERVESGTPYVTGADGKLRPLVLSPRIKGAEPGERLQLEATGQVALYSLGRESQALSLDEVPAVSWDDIGGLDEAKETLREAVEYPAKHAALYKRYGQRPSKGVLLYGPPGTGKTMLGKAIAHAMGAESFIHMKGPEVLSMWVGQSESAVREAFARARYIKQQTRRPAVLFIDEADAVLSSRTSNSQAHIGSMSGTIVPAFLSEMDGIEESGAFVVLSTNRPDILDPAIVRDGRIDRRVHIGRPDRAQAAKIFELALRGRPTAVDPEGLAKAASMVLYDFDARRALFEIDMGSGGSEWVMHADLASGALIVGVVQRATELAIRRERLGSKSKGIEPGDLYAAIDGSLAELRGLDHTDVLREKLERLGREPVAIRKVTHAEAEKGRRPNGVGSEQVQAQVV